ncbi:glutaredoxin [Streptomyces rishiriensis]|uniref:Glutaredoxin n=2 Tax=Streptomyces rishiriensis TaxID=68264 RepID=A0ABU0NU00_STRRH|nr:glutaredoxin [Streptomyces rishiriensis]
MSIAILFGGSGAERFEGCELSMTVSSKKRENGGMTPLFRRKAAPGGRSVTLIRKSGCHLCDDAERVIEKVCGELGVSWEQKDIADDRELYDQYWEQIPVVLVDGRQHTFWRVDESRLRKELAG